jgi:hypothetical protein
VPGAHVEVHAAGSATQVCVASSHDSPAPQGKSGTLHPGTQAPVTVHRSPTAQFAVEQGEMQTPLAESQAPPTPQGPVPEQDSLQMPSPESQVCPWGHPSVMQSAGAETH